MSITTIYIHFSSIPIEAINLPIICLKKPLALLPYYHIIVYAFRGGSIKSEEKAVSTVLLKVDEHAPYTTLNFNESR